MLAAVTCPDVQDLERLRRVRRTPPVEAGDLGIGEHLAELHPIASARRSSATPTLARRFPARSNAHWTFFARCSAGASIAMYARPTGFPGVDWEQQAAYFFQRAIEHGRRRAEEMREAAVTVREAGMDPWSAAGAAERHSWIADLADAGLFGKKRRKRTERGPDWRVEADRILDHVHRVGEG